MTDGHQQAPESGHPRRPRYIMRRIVIVTMILVFGVIGSQYLIKTKPKVKRRPAEKIVPLVSVVPLAPSDQKITITAMGTVIPSRQIVLKTPVSGEIISLNDTFMPGGLLNEGTAVLQIDRRDYELALEQKKRTLAEAEYDYKLELGKQDVARREWNLLYGDNKGEGIESDLALRRPHLEKVEADVKAARAEMELASLNLGRTTVKAPFNGMILNKYVDKGAFVAPQEKLADMVGTDTYWVQVSLPQDRLQRLHFPSSVDEAGAPAQITYRQNTVRKGTVLRLMGDLSTEGRMARLIVEVPDPLGLADTANDAPPLIIGEYVRVEIEGEMLEQVFRLPRTSLHNDREIWLVDQEGRLKIHPVTTIWRDETFVLVRDDLHPGDRLVTSNLAVPVDGMEVRIDQEQNPDQKKARKKAKEAM